MTATGTNLSNYAERQTPQFRILSQRQCQELYLAALECLSRAWVPSQVALNWLICKGAVPIPGAKNLRQAQENFGALGWRLTDDEVARLDEESEKVTSDE